MKKLTEMIQDVENMSLECLNEDEHKAPIFAGYCELRSDFEERLKLIQLKKSEEILYIAYDAFVSGAEHALSLLKHGKIVRDFTGKPIDNAYYSLEELLSEARSLLNKKEQLSMLQEDLQFIETIDGHNLEEEYSEKTTSKLH